MEDRRPNHSKRSRIKLSKKDYKELCEQVHERDGWKCKVCRLRKPLHAHHVIFRSHGGDDADWNLISTCSDCHDAIHNRYVVVLPCVDGADLDANQGVRFIFVNDWKPIIHADNGSRRH